MGGLWDYIKTTIADHVDGLIEEVKQTVLYATIEKALTYILGLFNPIGGFIKIVKAIYAGIRFLVDNMEQIKQEVDAEDDEAAQRRDDSLRDGVGFAGHGQLHRAEEGIDHLLDLFHVIDEELIPA